jgi:hypothetical protein
MYIFTHVSYNTELHQNNYLKEPPQYYLYVWEHPTVNRALANHKLATNQC